MALKNSQLLHLYTLLTSVACTRVLSSRKGKEEDVGNWENERRNEESLQMSEEFGKQVGFIGAGGSQPCEKNFRGAKPFHREK